MPETSLGDSTFSAIRRGHFVYVDKTEFIAQLLRLNPDETKKAAKRRRLRF